MLIRFAFPPSFRCEKGLRSASALVIILRCSQSKTFSAWLRIAQPYNPSTKCDHPVTLFTSRQVALPWILQWGYTSLFICIWISKIIYTRIMRASVNQRILFWYIPCENFIFTLLLFNFCEVATHSFLQALVVFVPFTHLVALLYINLETD